MEPIHPVQLTTVYTTVNPISQHTLTKLFQVTINQARPLFATLAAGFIRIAPLLLPITIGICAIALAIHYLRNRKQEASSADEIEEQPEETSVSSISRYPTPMSEDFISYIEQHNKDLKPEEANHLADFGEMSLKSLREKGDVEDRFKRHEAHFQLAAITWAFMRKAMEKGQSFSEGAFLIEDPKGIFYEYLQSLEPYVRPSSHLTKRTSEPCLLFRFLPFKLPIFTSLQFGIDVKAPLPNQHRTILFAQTDPSTPQQALFFKPEKAGADITTFDFWFHMIDYFISLVRRGKAGANEQAGMRKERVPHEALEKFSALLDAYCIKQGLEDSVIASRAPKPKEITMEGSFVLMDLPENCEVDLRDSKDQHMKKALGFGIQYINKFMEELKSRPGAEPSNEFAVAKQDLETYLASFDRNDLRNGNEVILSLSDF